MKSSRYRDTLFIVFAAIFSATAIMCLVGVWISWSGQRELPYLSYLLGLTIGEVCAAIVLLYRHVFPMNDKKSVDLKRSIRDCFTLFKSCISAKAAPDARFRLNFLRYEPKTEKLAMYVQDDDYPDLHFVIDCKEGVDKGIVVCEAAIKRSLIVKNLAPDQYISYSDSPIQSTLASVVAFPIRSTTSSLLAVISLDSEKKLEDLEIEKRDLEDLFVRMCTIIERTLHDLEVEEL